MLKTNDIDISKPHSNGFRKWESQKLNDEFNEIFGIDFQHFYDSNGLSIDGKIYIDVVKFNEYLDDCYGDLRDNKSMFDLILDEYGVKAVKLIEKLLPDKEKPLDKEFHWYLANQNELVKKYNGKYIVIIGEEVVDAYRTYEGAYFESKDKFELGTFLIQKVSEGDKDYTTYIYTPNIGF
ncbi:MAG: DUF5678 domain-containing protein [Firmicutes bacterium]|nr:DUF5678 domain-containing protein [Bacillota bacterium]